MRDDRQRKRETDGERGRQAGKRETGRKGGDRQIQKEWNEGICH